jgi:putative restriction endonuclease
LPDIDEVNFWQPSGGSAFRALQPGEPFLFKLRYPEPFIVGGGFFAGHSVLPVSLAWEAFGEKNGATTFEEMRARIERLRRIPPDPSEDYPIGCIVLTQPFFFDRDDWFDPPADFSKNIQRGKMYGLAPPGGSALWEAVQMRLLGREVDEAIGEAAAPMFGEPTLVRPRLGQGAFRILVTDTYERRCAVTQEKILPVLEAAHIRPVTRDGVHRIDNGLLLRSDVHTLFDRGYVTITPDMRFRVSRRLRDDFNNGEYYSRFDGAEVWAPHESRDRPSPANLEWHADEVFLR